MTTIKECFEIILKGEKEESRLAARTVRKVLYGNKGGANKFQDIDNIISKAPLDYSTITEDWRKENFVTAISVISFLGDKEKDFDSLFSWGFQLLQHPNGNIRFAAVKMFERDIRQLTIHIRFPSSKHDEARSKKEDSILNTLRINLNRLLSDLRQPGYGRYKYIDSMPACPYKSVQMVLFELEDCYADIHPDEDFDEVESIDDYYFDAMDCLYEGEADRAIKLLEKALGVDSHYLPGFVGLSSAYLGKGDIEKHKEYVNRGFEEVKRIYPEWPDRIMWGDIEERSILRMICYKAGLEHSSGNLEEAETLYRLLLKLNPSDNQGVRYLITAMFAGFGPEYVDKLMEEGNKKQNWGKLESLFEEQNKKHDFCSYEEDSEEDVD